MEEVFIFRKGQGVWKQMGFGKLAGNQLVLEESHSSSLGAETYIGRQIETDAGWEIQLQRFVQTNAKPFVEQKDWQIDIQGDILRFPEDKYRIHGSVIELLGEE